METLVVPPPSDALPAPAPALDSLREYYGYDNPILIGDLAEDIREAIASKPDRSAASMRGVRTWYIERYLDKHLDADGLGEDEMKLERRLAREQIKYWLSVDANEWAGDMNGEGLVGNGLYHKLGLGILERTNGNGHTLPAITAENGVTPPLLFSPDIVPDNSTQLLAPPQAENRVVSSVLPAPSAENLKTVSLLPAPAAPGNVPPPPLPPVNLPMPLPPPEARTNTELDSLYTQVTVDRYRYARELARHSRRVFFDPGVRADLHIAENHWQNSMLAYAKAYHQKSIMERPPTVSEENWRGEINQRLLIDSTYEYKLLEEAKVNALEGTKVGKFVDIMNRGGIVKRMLKGFGVGVAVGVATIPLGFIGGVIGAGGIVAAGGIGLTRFARGFAGWQGRGQSLQGNSNADQAAYYRAVSIGGEFFSNDDYRNLDPADALKRALAIQQNIESNRNIEDRKLLRRSVAIGTGAVAVGAITSLLVHSLYVRLDIKDRIHDLFHGNNSPEATGARPTSPSVVPPVDQPGTGVTPPEHVSPPIGPKPPVIAHPPTPIRPDTIDPPKTGGTIKPPLQPVEPTVPTPQPPVEITPAPPIVTPEVVVPIAPVMDAHFDSLVRLVNAPGQYPWDRAESFFNGDQQMTNTWIHNAATKAGATWHGSGKDAWISIDGSSDTDYVWDKLVSASLQP